MSLSLSERLIPIMLKDWGFFDRQRSIFSDLHKGMDDEFKEFDRELEIMRRDMFRLTPMDFGSFDSGLLKIDNPIVTDQDGQKKLAIRFNVSEFKPEEITVKTMNNKLMIEAKHVEESPGRRVYREFSKQYILPNKIDALNLTSTLSKDGVLHIEAPAPEAIEAPKERFISIKYL